MTFSFTFRRAKIKEKESQRVSTYEWSLRTVSARAARKLRTRSMCMTSDTVVSALVVAPQQFRQLLVVVEGRTRIDVVANREVVSQLAHEKGTVGRFGRAAAPTCIGLVTLVLLCPLGEVAHKSGTMLALSHSSTAPQPLLRVSWAEQLRLAQKRAQLI